MPVYNGDRYICQALDSLLAQDYENFEPIISDNASTDRTAEICQTYAAKYPQIRYYRNSKNLGASHNFNRVVERSAGSYFMWAAHDDLWHSSYIGQCLARLKQHPNAVLCFSGINFIDEQGKPKNQPYNNLLNTVTLPLDRRFQRLVAKLNWYDAFYGLIRLESLKKTRLCTNKYGFDVILLTELLLLGEFLKVPEKLFSYRIVDKSVANHLQDISPFSQKSATVVSQKPYSNLAQDLIEVINSSPLDLPLKKVLKAKFIKILYKHNLHWLSLILQEHSISVKQPISQVSLRRFLQKILNFSPNPELELTQLQSSGIETSLSRLPNIAQHQLHPKNVMNLNLGINIAGYVSSESGVGEGVRANIRSISATEIPFVVNNFTRSRHRQLDTSYQNFSQDNPYPINLIQVNAEQIEVFLKTVGSSYLENRYNIGYWAWELPTFPAEWQSAFSYFHEIWTYSNYAAEAISPSSPIPILKMMPSISLATPLRDREALGLPKDKFIFLFIFDFCSILERKNPLAAIAAFKQAFANNDNVTFIIKSANSQLFPQQHELLKSVLSNSPNIKHIDGYLSREEINALLYHCDCYVSLHRCEGFGLTMAEAMFYGKPVIATGYSSNTEFMNLGNSFLVRYNLVPLMTDLGPYKKGNIWADPDVDHAAYLMHFVVSNYEQSKQIAARGELEIKSLLNPHTRGDRIKNRLEYIKRFTGDFTTLSPTQASSDRPSLLIPAQQLSESISGTSELGYQSPLVSICIPTYNGEEFLQEAIQSALNQTYSQLEIIISDDGSTDRTLEISRSFQTESLHDYRIILHSNYGLAKNWNFCISQANGKYIKFLFQDDYLEPDCIEKMVALAEQDAEIGLVFSPRKIKLAQEAESDPLLRKASQSIKNLHGNWSNLKAIQLGRELLNDPNFLANPINKIGEPTTVLLAKKVFEKIGYFDANLSQYLDLDMWFRIMGWYKVGFVNEPVSSLRIHAGQQTWKNFSAGENQKDVCRLYEKMLHHSAYVFLQPNLKKQVKQKLELKLARFQATTPNLTTLINQYQKSSNAQSALKKLGQVRQEIAEKWLNLSASEWAVAYAEEIGKIHQLLLQSGIKHEAIDREEVSFIEPLLTQLTQKEAPLNLCLAAMLYYDAYQLPLQYKNAAIPRWFFKDYLEYLLAAPNYFKELGEIEKYSKYIQEIFDYIYLNILSQPQAEIWRYLSSFIANAVDLSPLLVTTDNLLNIYSKRAKIVEIFLQNLGCQIHNNEFLPIVQRLGKSKIKIGIVRDEIDDFSEGFSMIPVVQHLDRKQFEIVLYSFKIADLELADFCQKCVDRSIQLPDTLSAQVDLIRAENLDILLIDTAQTGTPNISTLLSAHRLAPVQVVTAASTPVTTGMSQIDYCLVGSLIGSFERARSQYRESLVAMEGSGFCFSEPSIRSEATVKPTRNSWGASDSTVVFMSAARAKNLIPELRETWVKVIAAVPNSILVLYPFRRNDNNYPVTPFVKQMRSLFNQAGIDPRRLVAIKALPTRADFRECLKLADIYLDSFPNPDPWELVEALLTGIPTIVNEGETVRSCQTAAILRELQIPELIAQTENSYIELCRTLGSGAQLRQHYRQHIQQQIASSPPLVNTQAYSAQIGTLLEKLWRDPSQVVRESG